MNVSKTCKACSFKTNIYPQFFFKCQISHLGISTAFKNPQICPDFSSDRCHVEDSGLLSLGKQTDYVWLAYVKPN